MHDERGPDGRYASDQDPVTRLGKVAALLRATCPRDPQSVTEDAFDDKHAQLEDFDCPEAQGVCDWLGVRWERAKEIALSGRLPTGIRHPGDRADPEPCDAKTARWALLLAHRRLVTTLAEQAGKPVDPDTVALTVAAYRRERDALRRPSTRTGRPLELPSPDAIAAALGFKFAGCVAMVGLPTGRDLPQRADAMAFVDAILRALADGGALPNSAELELYTHTANLAVATPDRPYAEHLAEARARHAEQGRWAPQRPLCDSDGFRVGWRAVATPVTDDETRRAARWPRERVLDGLVEFLGWLAEPAHADRRDRLQDALDEWAAQAPRERPGRNAVGKHGGLRKLLPLAAERRELAQQDKAAAVPVDAEPAEVLTPAQRDLARLIRDMKGATLAAILKHADAHETFRPSDLDNLGVSSSGRGQALRKLVGIGALAQDKAPATPGVRGDRTRFRLVVELTTDMRRLLADAKPPPGPAEPIAVSWTPRRHEVHELCRTLPARFTSRDLQRLAGVNLASTNTLLRELRDLGAVDRERAGRLGNPGFVYWVVDEQRTPEQVRGLVLAALEAAGPDGTSAARIARAADPPLKAADVLELLTGELLEQNRVVRGAPVAGAHKAADRLWRLLAPGELPPKRDGSARTGRRGQPTIAERILERLDHAPPGGLLVPELARDLDVHGSSIATAITLALLPHDLVVTAPAPPGRALRGTPPIYRLPQGPSRPECEPAPQQITRRGKLRTALDEAGPDGLLISELVDRSGVDVDGVRYVLLRMYRDGEAISTHEGRLARIRLVRHAPAANDPQPVEDVAAPAVDRGDWTAEDHTTIQAARTVTADGHLTPTRLAKTLRISKTAARARLERLVDLDVATTRDVDLPELAGETLYLLDDDIADAA